MIVRILALETSGRVGSAALLNVEGGTPVLLSQRELPTGQRTAQSLIPTVEEMLQEHGWTPGSIGLVGVATGPGSFTGLRIGVVAAKAFAYATGAKLVGVHTLAALADGVGVEGRRLWAVLDAQRQELFAAAFNGQRSVFDQRQPATEVLALADFAARLADGDVVAGPPLEKIRELIATGATLADASSWTPTAASVGRLAAQAYAVGETVDPLQLVPNYFRKSAAEEKAAATS
jgi:tRNA threonylcarbamoyladenosine biosynthesis protein TsaB